MGKSLFRDGQILLIRRDDNGLWAMPGGVTEVGETWSQSVERELWEETGLHGTATALLGVFDSRFWGSRAKNHFYSSVWLVNVPDGQTPTPGPETTDVGFFSEGNLPDLSPGHVRRLPKVFDLVRGDSPVPYLDMATR